MDRAGIILFTITGLLIFFVAAIPLPYTAVELYAKNISYEEKEAYTIEEPVESEKCSLGIPEYRSWMRNWTWVTKNLNQPMITIEIMNLENKTVTYTYSVYSYTCDNPSIFTEKANEMTIRPNDKGYADVAVPAKLCYNYSVSPHKVNKCRKIEVMQNITKERTATKYKDDLDERKVTNYATLFDQWTGKVKLYYRV